EWRDLMVAVSLLLGFQFTLFKWRIEREAGMIDKKQWSWLPPADWVGMLSMLCFVIGVILLPIVGAIDVPTARKVFGLAALLAVAQIIGLAGHYELFLIKKRTKEWFPPQERLVLLIFGIIVICYCWRAWF